MLSLAVFVAVALTGCSSANYQPPIASFQESVVTGSGAVATYFTEMNRFERDLYLHDVAYDASIELATAVVDASGVRKPTALPGKTFSPRSIQARVDALRLVGLYAQGLGELASSEAPAAFGDSARQFGEQLAGTFTKLQGDAADSSAKAYLGPLSTIVAEVGKKWIEAKRDAMLAESIEAAAPQVHAVLTQIEEDLQTVVKPLRETGEKQMLASLVTNYNKARSGMSLEQRKAALDAIAAAYDRYAVVTAADPAVFVRNMRSAFDQLVKYAKSGHSPSDVRSLVAHLKSLEGEAKRLWSSVDGMRNVKKGD